MEAEPEAPSAAAAAAVSESVAPLTVAEVGSTREHTVYARTQEGGYSLRRMVYVFGTTVFLLISNTAFVAFGYNGELVTKYAEASFSLMGAICLYYLGAGVLDRSEVLRRVGEGFGRRNGGGDRPSDDCPPRT